MNISTKTDWKFFWRAIRIFAPIIASGIIMAAIGFVDNIFVSGSSVHDGVGQGMDKIDFKAVGAGNEIFFLTSSLGVGLTVLFAILFSQFANRHKDFVDAFKINLIFALGISLTTSLICFIIPEKLISLFFLGETGPDKDLVIKHGSNFVRILALGQIFYILSLSLINPMVIKGKVKYGLYLSLISLVINAILDAIFIYGFKWGAEGSAWSTDIAYFVEFILVCFFLFKNKKWFTGWMNIFNFNINVLFQALKRIGIYLFFVLMQATFAITTILWTTFYGSDLIAPVTTGYIIANLMFATFGATTRGVSIFIGSLLGDNKMDEAKVMAHKLWFPNVFLCCVFMLLAGITSTFFPQLLLNSNDDVFRARWVIISFIISLPAYIGVTYYSAIFEVGGLQWVPNFWNRGFPIWAQATTIVLMSSYVLGVEWMWAFLISNAITYVAFGVIYFKFRKYNWLNQIKTDQGF